MSRLVLLFICEADNLSYRSYFSLRISALIVVLNLSSDMSERIFLLFSTWKMGQGVGAARSRLRRGLGPLMHLERA